MNLQTRSGYFARYYELIPLCRTNLEAFLTLEKELYQKHKKHRYKNWDSFRMQLKYWNYGVNIIKETPQGLRAR